MPRNGAGLYTLPAGNPVVTGTTITSGWANTTDDDLAQAISDSLAANGETTPTANLKMGGFRHTGVGNPQAYNQYQSAKYAIDDKLHYVQTVGGTANAVTLAPTFSPNSYVIGQYFTFVPTALNTGATTVNVSTMGVKDLKDQYGGALIGGELTIGQPVTIRYNGTYFYIENKSGKEVTYMTFASLKAETVFSPNKLYVTVGYTNVFDGGGSKYLYDPTSTATDDSFSVIKPTAISGAGRLLIVDAKSVNIVQAGAIEGDSGANAAANQTAINNALIYAATSPYAQVVIPEGVFVIGGTRSGTYNAILNIYSNVSIVGYGYNSTLKTATDFTLGGDYRVMAPIAASTISNFRIEGVRFDGNATGNVVLGSTGTDVRRAYSINILTGNNIDIMNCWFENNPGRNVINLGNNVDPPSIARARILYNQVRNVGGAITGNEAQNDHSSIYLQCDGGEVIGNTFLNDTAFDPFAAPTRAVVALEIHGRNTLVSNNIVRKYGTAGNAVAQSHDAFNNIWEYNQFLELYSNAITLWTASNKRNVNLTFRGNTIHMDNSSNSGGNGIFQNTSSTITTRQIENLIIENNVIMCELTTGKAVTTYGIQITAVNGCRIRRNTFMNIQGNAISLESATTALDINDVDISENYFINCGIHTAVTRIWNVYIANLLTTRLFSNIRVNNNVCVKPLQDVAATPLTSRGMRVLGPGLLENITFKDNVFTGYQRAQRIDIATPTNNINVAVIPSVIMSASASSPVNGMFEIGKEEIRHTDTAAGGAVGRITTTSGSAVSGLWATATQYYEGQWIRTSTNKVLECTVSGISDAATEPTPATLGIALTDGTVTWAYRDTVIAAFTNYGESYLTATVVNDPASLAVGVCDAEQTTTVTGAALGDVVRTSFSLDTQGLIINARVSAANTVKWFFQNPSGNPNGTINLASGTVSLSVMRP